jgi:hypothetical protein
MDSRYQWGKAIVGVSLGMDSIMYSTPNSSANGGNDVDIFIPRRSIYVMTDDSRYNYKHGIRPQETQQTVSPLPWNPHSIWRSMIFRTTKCVSDILLERMVNRDPRDAVMRRRLQEQVKFRPQEVYGSLAVDDVTLKRMRQRACFSIYRMWFNPNKNARFGVVNLAGSNW